MSKAFTHASLGLDPLTNDATSPKHHSNVFFVPMVLQTLLMERCMPNNVPRIWRKCLMKAFFTFLFLVLLLARSIMLAAHGSAFGREEKAHKPEV